MEWESRPDSSFEARSGELLFSLSAELGRREIGWWRLRVYRLAPLAPMPVFASTLEARAAVRQLAADAEGRSDAEIAELLSRHMPSA